jgi:AraC family transcriptional regulator of adaptative response / DNA-3-methyladenine glycosylase II
LSLGYRPPYAWANLISILEQRAIPQEIYEKLRIMNEVRPNICLPGLRLPGCFDPYEMAVRAILGQQVMVKAARTLAMRLSTVFGQKIDTPFERLSVTFPHPEMINELEGPLENHLGPLGVTGARARSILALTKALLEGSITFSADADPEIKMEKLHKLPGFEPWTVQYIGMRALGWPDAFPHTDYGVKKALPGLTPAQIIQLSQVWRPWRAYAVLNLWNSLKEEDG